MITPASINYHVNQPPRYLGTGRTTHGVFFTEGSYKTLTLSIWAIFYTGLFEGYKINMQAPDRWRWGNDMEGRYSIKAGYSKQVPSVIWLITGHGYIRKIKLPTKIIRFSWTTLHKACLARKILDVICASRILSQRNTCSFIVEWLQTYMNVFSISGLSWGILNKHLNDGVIGELVSPSNKYGGWSLQISFGVSGQKGSEDVLMVHQLQFISLRLDV